MQVAGVARDLSVTIVSFCQKGANLPQKSPTLIGDGGELVPFGGNLEKHSSGWINYIFYPTTTSSRLSVEYKGDTVAGLDFDGPPRRSDCDQQVGGRFNLVACGAFLVFDWDSPMKFRANRVELVDGVASDGEMLGFQVLGYASAGKHLRIRFALRRPARSKVDIAIHFVYVKRGDGSIEEIAYDPPLETSFVLR